MAAITNKMRLSILYFVSNVFTKIAAVNKITADKTLMKKYWLVWYKIDAIEANASKHLVTSTSIFGLLSFMLKVYISLGAGIINWFQQK